MLDRLKSVDLKIPSKRKVISSLLLLAVAAGIANAVRDSIVHPQPNPLKELIPTLNAGDVATAEATISNDPQDAGGVNHFIILGDSRVNPRNVAAFKVVPDPKGQGRLCLQISAPFAFADPEKPELGNNGQTFHSLIETFGDGSYTDAGQVTLYIDGYEPITLDASRKEQLASDITYKVGDTGCQDSPN